MRDALDAEAGRVALEVFDPATAGARRRPRRELTWWWGASNYLLPPLYGPMAKTCVPHVTGRYSILQDLLIADQSNNRARFVPVVSGDTFGRS